MKLLPFNLEEALKNPDRVVYRNGEKPLEWHLFEKAKNYPIVSIRESGDRINNNINGFQSIYSIGYPYDLMLLPLPEKQYWVNVYEVQGKIQLSVPFESEEQAFKEIVLPLKLIRTISFTVQANR